MPEKISSTSNPRIKNLIQLQSKSRERRNQNRIVIEGAREIFRAVKAGFLLRELYYCSEFDRDDRVGELVHLLPDYSVFNISPTVFEKVAYREGSDGIIAIVEPRNLRLEDINFGENPLFIVLESVEKPGNLGAVMRTADAAKVDAVIICDPLTDLYNPNTIRSSVGCIFTCPVVAGTTEEVRKWLFVKHINTYAAALSDTAEYYHLKDYTLPTAFIMGTEATGLSGSWLEHCTSQVIIPMRGIADSLNVSVSAAILVFEAMRQRNFEV